MMMKTLRDRWQSWLLAAGLGTVLVLAGGACPGAGALAGEAADLSGREVMERMDAANRTEDFRAEIAMELVDLDTNRVRERRIEMFAMEGPAGETRSLIRFTAPGDVAGTGFLSIQEGDEDTQYLYLPSVRRVRRIGGAQERDSFVGTDFSYADLDELQHRDLDDYVYERLPDDDIEGRDVYVVEAVPANPETVERTGYGRMVLEIEQERLVILRARLFDEDGADYKVLTARDIEPVSGAEDVHMARRLTMTNLQDDHETVLSFTSIEANTGLVEDLFTTRSLRRP